MFLLTRALAPLCATRIFLGRQNLCRNATWQDCSPIELRLPTSNRHFHWLLAVVNPYRPYLEDKSWMVIICWVCGVSSDQMLTKFALVELEDSKWHSQPGSRTRSRTRSRTKSFHPKLNPKSALLRTLSSTNSRGNQNQSETEPEFEPEVVQEEPEAEPKFGRITVEPETKPELWRSPASDCKKYRPGNTKNTTRKSPNPETQLDLK